MGQLDTRKIQCPYCGELIEVVLDCSIVDQSYIEDCQVCCRPIDFSVRVDHSGDIFVSVSHENE